MGSVIFYILISCLLAASVTEGGPTKFRKFIFVDDAFVCVVDNVDDDDFIVDNVGVVNFVAIGCGDDDDNEVVNIATNGGDTGFYVVGVDNYDTVVVKDDDEDDDDDYR